MNLLVTSSILIIISVQTLMVDMKIQHDKMNELVDKLDDLPTLDDNNNKDILNRYDALQVSITKIKQKSAENLRLQEELNDIKADMEKLESNQAKEVKAEALVTCIRHFYLHHFKFTQGQVIQHENALNLCVHMFVFGISNYTISNEAINACL